jgi:GAG-pre-integrase domain
MKPPPSSSFNALSPQAYISTRTSINGWHARFGHTSMSTTIKVINNNSLPCIRNNLSSCHDCLQAKAHVLPFASSSSSFTSSPLQIVHSDV